MPRIPTVSRDDLDEYGRAIYDGIAESRAHVQGPFGVLLYSPELAKRIAHLGAYVRYEAPIADRTRHLIVMTCARALDCQYEFTVHAGLARGHGISDDVIGALDRAEAPSGLEGEEQLVVDFTRQLVIGHRVDDSTFAALVNTIGVQRLTDIVGMIGYFSMIAFPLNAFDVEVRPEHTPQLSIAR